MIDRFARWLLIYGALIVAVGLLFMRLPTGFLPAEDQGIAYIQLQTPPGATQGLTWNALDDVAILVEGDGVTTVRAGAVDPSVKRDGANGYYITPLVDVLTKHANRLKKITAMGGTQFDGTAMILVDKNTPYRLLTEVLYSAGQAEFKNYHLVVIRRAQ